MLGIVFYLIFGATFFLTIYFSLKQPINVLYTLLISSQFNVTSFFKLGLTFSFFEINLLICSVIFSYLYLIKPVALRSPLIPSDKIFILFLIISIVSIVIGIIRVGIGDLVPDDKIPTYFLARSFMSLNKLFVFLPTLIFIREFLLNRYDDNKVKIVFIKALVISGVLPMLAALIQSLGIGFYLIHNNPSFSEVFRVENYIGQRIVGLSNEASFFVYQLFFSTLGIYYAQKLKLYSKKKLYVLAMLYVLTVIISISRTGLLIFILFACLIAYRTFKKNILSFFLKSIFIGPFLLAMLLGLATLNVGGFNLSERLLSTFQVDADSSTLERYGTMDALFNLIIDKCLFLGTGIYNYQYYIKEYLPYYMDLSNYGKGDTPPSFNFVLQLFAEFGFPLALLFFGWICLILKKAPNDLLVKDWFLFLFLFSLSFQALNFAVPFLIILYPSRISNENSLRTR